MPANNDKPPLVIHDAQLVNPPPPVGSSDVGNPPLAIQAYGNHWRGSPTAGNMPLLFSVSAGDSEAAGGNCAARGEPGRGE